MGASINQSTSDPVTDQMAEIWRKAFARACQPKSTAKHDEKVGEVVSRAIRRSVGARFEMSIRPHIRMVTREIV
jgi:hypothetical protein